MHHVAIVYAPRGVLFLSVTHSRAARERELGEYVSKQAMRQLSPATRDEVLELLERGAIPAGVRRYFETVVREWDEEWLYLASLEDGHSAAGEWLPALNGIGVLEKAGVAGPSGGFEVSMSK